MQNKIKIIPTMAIYNSFAQYEEVMRLFSEENIDMIRINMTRFEPARYIYEIVSMRETYKKIAPNLKLKILLDIPLPGKKPRVYFNGKESKKKIYNGEKVTLTFQKECVDVEKNIFAVDDCEFIAYLCVKKSKYVYFDDGKLKCQVIDINDDFVETIAQNDGVISFCKSVYADGYYFSPVTDVFFEKYLDAINAIKPEYIALSFVENASDVKKIKNSLMAPIKIVSKIETPCGANNIDDIVKISDAIMIGRGDLAITSGIALFCKIHDKLLEYSNYIDVYVATDILQSVVENEFPNRADLIDVNKLIVSNVKGLITSGRTARGFSLKRFKRVVDMIKGEYHL